MVLDSDNSIISVGSFSDSVDFDAAGGTFNLVSNGLNDIFITKYSSNGNFISAKSIGSATYDEIEAINKDSQENLYILGKFQDTLDFDLGPGNFKVSTVSGLLNTFLLKLDRDGNFLWVKTITGWGNTLDIDELGNILIGGYFGGTVDFDPGPGVHNITSNTQSQDMFVMKLDKVGNFVWAKQIRNLNKSQHQEFGLETDPFGNIFFAGSFTDSMDFDPGPSSVHLTSNGANDAFILKLNTNGDYQWVRQLGGESDDKAFGLEVDKQGNVFSTGEFEKEVDFDPGPAIFSLTAPVDKIGAFVSKLDSSGNFVYAKNFQSGEAVGQSLAIDSANNLYISGIFHNTVDFDPGPGVYYVDIGDMFNVKLDSAGELLWAAGYRPMVNRYFESIWSTILIDSSNSVYFGGTFPYTVDFDPGNATLPISAIGLWDMFLLKLGPISCNSSTRRVINAESCGNYILNGTSYNSSGQFFQLLKNKAGCDSIIELNLTLSHPQINQIQVSCGPLLWNGKVLSTSGVYIDTIHLANGCDSIMFLNLTVHQKPKFSLGRDTSFCEGDTINLSAGNFASYHWSDNTTASDIIITQPGIYWVEVTDSNGCSSRDSLDIKLAGDCLSCLTSDVIEKIYPSPFNSTLSIRIKNSDCEINIDVYNVLGQLVIKGLKLQSGINTINMERFPSGMYFYKIYTNHTALTEGKVLKQ